jgi:hypothetical protein
LSVYVTGTFAACCAVWLLIVLLKGWWRYAVVLCVSGFVAAALAFPFLFRLAQGFEPSHAPAPAPFPVRFSVRTFLLAQQILNPRSRGGTVALNAAMLPLNYFLEYGFFLAVACLGVRRIQTHGFQGKADLSASALAATALLVSTFLRSALIESNDLGCRSALVVQFILLLWAAEMWNEGVLGFAPPRTGGAVAPSRSERRLIALTLILGAMGTCYEFCVQRTFPILSDSFATMRYPWLSPDHQLGRRTFELRRAYEELDGILPASAIVQHNPEAWVGNIPAELYSNRQMVADAAGCGTVFGGSEKVCEDILLPRLKRIFDGRPPATAEEAANTCRDFSISALLFKDTDSVWADQSSWIWKAHPLVSSDFVRVIACGGRR